MNETRYFRNIFLWMMIFVGAFWVWTVTLMVAWPWQQTVRWAPEMRLYAQCQAKGPCSITHAALPSAREKGEVISITPTEPAGEVMEADAWLKWKKAEGKPWDWEVKRSSWSFEYALRYRIEGEQVHLVEAREVDSRMLGLALPLALFTVLGLFLRSLRSTQS